MLRSPLPLAVLLAIGCATVPPGAGGVVLAPSGVQPQPLGEGVSSIPWFGQVTLYDLREQQVTVRFTTLTSDGCVMATSASVVTFRIVREELVEFARTVGPDYAQLVVRPETEAALRTVLGGIRFADLDSERIVAAQREVTRLAAARLRPYHLILESVDLRSLRMVAPLVSIQVTQALMIEQDILATPRQLEVVAQKAEARRVEASGLAGRFEAIAPTLTPETLADLHRRAWARLLTSPSSSVVVESAGSPAILEVWP